MDVFLFATEARRQSCTVPGQCLFKIPNSANSYRYPKAQGPLAGDEQPIIGTAVGLAPF